MILVGDTMKFKINYIEKNKESNLIEKENYINIYFLGIRVKKIKLERKIHAPYKKNNTKTNTIYMILKQIIRSLKYDEIVNLVIRIPKTIKIHKLDMDLGINLNDPIYNAYAIAVINVVIPLLIAYNSKSINLDNIKYTTFISDKTLFLNIKCNVSISIIKNIFRIFKVIFALIKLKIKELKKDKTKNSITNKLAQKTI